MCRLSAAFGEKREAFMTEESAIEWHTVRSKLPELLRRVKWLMGPRRLIGYSAFFLVYAVQRLWIRDYITVSPTRPGHGYSLWKLCRLAGIRMVAENAPETLRRKHCLARVRHNDDTWDQPHPTFVNGECTDISKTHVDHMFEKAFGYATRVDPTTFNGRAVMKAERNCSDGGIFVDCPIDASAMRSDHIYQRLIDNETSEGIVKEFRVAVICGEIADVIVQYRSIDFRLQGRGSGGSHGSTACKAVDVFSPTDIRRVLHFCALMGLDFGELDILPDVNDGRLYILDANKTPSYMVDNSAFRLDRFVLAYRRGMALRRLLRGRSETNVERATASRARIESSPKRSH
jgi:hypothetical protein